MTYADGTAVAQGELPIAVQDACILIAGSAATDPSHTTPANTGGNIKMVSAGTAEVEFFTPNNQTIQPVVQDAHALELIKQFLKTTTTGSGGRAGTASFIAGTDQSTQPFERSEGF